MQFFSVAHYFFEEVRTKSVKKCALLHRFGAHFFFGLFIRVFFCEPLLVFPSVLSVDFIEAYFL